jgi:hypothetical protein
MSTTTNTFAAATLATVKSFLVAAEAYVGVPSAMKFDGWRITEVRAYAERVQVLRDGGFTGNIAPSIIDAAEQQVADDLAAAEAARVAAEAATAAELMALVEAQVASATPKKKEQAKGSDAHRTMLQRAIEMGERREDGSVVLTTSLLMEVGFSKSYGTQRCGWSAIKCGGTVARQLGYVCNTATDKTQPSGFVVVLRPVA